MLPPLGLQAGGNILWDSPGSKDTRGQDLSLEVTHLQLFLVVMGKFMPGKIPVNWWKSRSRMGTQTCPHKLFSWTFKHGQSRKTRLREGGCVNLPGFMCETGFTARLSRATLPTTVVGPTDATRASISDCS